MAKTATKSIARRAPSVPKKKYEMALRGARSANARAKRVANERIGTLVGMGTGYAVGRLERSGKKLPTVGGVEPTAVCGAALAFLPSMLGIGGGRLGTIAAEAGSALLGLAAYKVGKGIAPLVAGDDGGEGWEPG